eukprot:jgi/Mesen1/1566/ME000134S00686
MQEAHQEGLEARYWELALAGVEKLDSLESWWRSRNMSLADLAALVMRQNGTRSEEDEFLYAHTVFGHLRDKSDPGYLVKVARQKQRQVAREEETLARKSTLDHHMAACEAELWTSCHLALPR